MRCQRATQLCFGCIIAIVLAVWHTQTRARTVAAVRACPFGPLEASRDQSGYPENDALVHSMTLARSCINVASTEAKIFSQFGQPLA